MVGRRARRRRWTGSASRRRCCRSRRPACTSATARRVDLAREVNEAGRRAVVDHPGRFGLLASLPLPDVDAAIAEIALLLRPPRRRRLRAAHERRRHLRERRVVRAGLPRARPPRRARAAPPDVAGVLGAHVARPAPTDARVLLRHHADRRRPRAQRHDRAQPRPRADRPARRRDAADRRRPRERVRARCSRPTSTCSRDLGRLHFDLAGFAVPAPARRAADADDARPPALRQRLPVHARAGRRGRGRAPRRRRRARRRAALEHRRGSSRPRPHERTHDEAPDRARLPRPRGARPATRSTPVFADVVGLVPGEPTAAGADTWRNDDTRQPARRAAGRAPTTRSPSASRRSTPPRSTRTVARLRAIGVDVADGDASERGVQTPRPHHRAVGRRRRDRARPRRRGRRPFSSPLVPGGFLTDGVGFGHAVFATTAFDESHRFLTDGLGFGQSDWLEMELAPGIELEVRFYHCNARHHTLALARAPFELPQTLHHVMFETNERDDVGAAFDRAWATDLPIPNGLGRHDNDGMFSFYLQTPGRLPDRGRPRRPGRRPTTGTTTAATTASARGVTSRCARREHDVDVDVAIVGYGPVGNALGDPARAARALGHRARAVARAVPAAARGALRPRGRPHPPVVRHRRRAAGDQRAGRGLRVAQRRRHDAAALRPDRRRPVRLAGVVDVQPAELERCSTAARARSASTSAAASRSPASTSTTTTSSSPAPTARPSRRASSSAATAPTARCATLLGVPVTDLGFFYDWLIVDVILDEPRVFDPDQPPDLRPGAADDGGVGRPGSAALGVHAPAARVARRAATTRRARGSCSRRGTCTPATPGSSATPSTRSTRATPSSGAPGACSSPATPRTSCRRSPARACARACATPRTSRGSSTSCSPVAPATRCSTRYESERLPSAKAAIEFSMELGKVICVPDPAEAARPRRGDGRRRRRRAGPRARPARHRQRVHPPDRAARGHAARAGPGRRPAVRRRARQRLAPRRPRRRRRPHRPRTSARGSSRSAAAIVALADPDPSFVRWFAEHDTTCALQRPDFYLYGTAPTAGSRDVAARRPSPPSRTGSTTT